MPRLIYHITHLNNLPGIILAGRLWCDSKCLDQGLTTTSIAHQNIKTRRRKRIVPVAAGGVLADYVPFNFCPRSVMLSAIYYGRVAGYTDGQEPIVHLVSTIEIATAGSARWAFTDRHAELAIAQYFDSLTALHEVDWTVMPMRFWAQDDNTKEKRQAEFLVHGEFPWSGIRNIAVKTEAAKMKVEAILQAAGHRPKVLCKPDCYY